MVHAPGLAQLAVEALRAVPPPDRLMLVVGHSHKQATEQFGTVTVLNPGSVGGGGTGNLTEVAGDIGLARVTYTRLPRFRPRAADVVQIDPGDGAAEARRIRLDGAAPAPQP
jgi:hypothetical protein